MIVILRQLGLFFPCVETAVSPNIDQLELDKAELLT